MSGTGLVLANFRKIIFFTAGVTLVLAGILGFFLVKRMLKPIRNITQTAQDIEENNLSRRLDVWSNDELGKLAATLNQMFERLEQSFSREHQFTAMSRMSYAHRWQSHRVKPRYLCSRNGARKNTEEQ